MTPPAVPSLARKRRRGIFPCRGRRIAAKFQQFVSPATPQRLPNRQKIQRCPGFRDRSGTFLPLGGFEERCCFERGKVPSGGKNARHHLPGRIGGGDPRNPFVLWTSLIETS